MAYLRVDDPEMPLADLMAAWPSTIEVFLRHRMLCVGCRVAPFHTVVDACAAYGLSPEMFLAELRAAAARPR